MFLTFSVASFQAAATAAGLVSGTDYAIRNVANGQQQLQPLSMKGLRFITWDLGLAVPPEDLAALQCNLLASIAGKATAWPQT